MYLLTKELDAENLTFCAKQNIRIKMKIHCKLLPLTIVLALYQTVLGSEEVTNDALTDSASSGEALTRVRRGGLSMLRLGRGLQMLRLGKRAPFMLRLGRAAPPHSPATNDDLQYLLSLMRNDRQVPLPRYGKDLALQSLLLNVLKEAEMNRDMYDDDEESDFGYGYELDDGADRQIRPAPRPGRFRRSSDQQQDNVQGDDHQNTRATPFPRFGKDLLETESGIRFPKARVAPLMRYGKDSEEVDDMDDLVTKRAMHMLRLGRGMRMLRLGKRPVDASAEDMDLDEVDKRALRLLRLGKRPFNMLRLGRSDNDDKRALRLLRLGKKSDTEQAES